MSLFGIVLQLAQWVVKAVYHFNATDEGGDELREIADALEAAGFDIPFYEPAEPPLDIQSLKVDEKAEAARAIDFLTRHPELFPQQGEGL